MSAEAEKHIQYKDELVRQAKIHYGAVWCITNKPSRKEATPEEFYFRKPTNAQFREIIKASQGGDVTYLSHYVATELYVCSKAPLPQKDDARILSIATELIPKVVGGGDTSVKEI